MKLGAASRPYRASVRPRAKSSFARRQPDEEPYRQPPLRHESRAGNRASAPPRPFVRRRQGQRWGDGGLQSIGRAVIDVTPGDCFQLPPTSGSTKNVAADELTWLAIEVVE
jgi:hypothetical protein